VLDHPQPTVEPGGFSSNGSLWVSGSFNTSIFVGHNIGLTGLKDTVKDYSPIWE